MKTKVKFVLSTLVAAAAMTNLAASAMGADIPEIPSDIVWDGTTNVKVESGTYGDIVGGTNITVLGKEDGTGPTVSDNKKFRGSKLGMNEADSHVYIYGGTYGDKVSGIHYTDTLKYTGIVNNATGHMYIYGGSFDSDITGFGMAQNTTGDAVYTANTDIYILGAISNGSGMGVYGGVAGGNGTSASLVGNTSVTVSGNGNTSFIVGGNRMANAKITGNASLTVKDGGTVGGILGGNYINDETDGSISMFDGNISIVVENGNVKAGKFQVSGIVAGGVKTNVTGTTSILISGNSSVSGGIAGGSVGWGTVSVSKSNIKISGGDIDISGNQTLPGALATTTRNALVGGNIAGVILTKGEGANYTMTTSSIEISGGSIKGGDIYGGGIAQGAKLFSTYRATSHVGTANITIDASQNKVAIAGNIYGGGRADDYGTATVGDVNIVFKGKGENLNFGGVVDGNGHCNGKSANASVTGTKTFTFDGYTGAFNGTIQNFDSLNVVNSKLTGNVKVGDDITVEKIHISGNSSVGKFVNKSGVTLTFGAEIESGSTLEIESGAIGGANSSVSSVELAKGASVTVTAAAGSAVTLTSVAGDVVVKEATQLDASKLSFENEDGVVLVQTSEVLAVWDFVVENAEGGVTVTMDVGEGQALESLRIFHEENGAWTDVTSVVTDKELKDGKLSFTTKDFSGYMVAAPEPSTFGLMAGLGALVLVGTRRRRR